MAQRAPILIDEVDQLDPDLARLIIALAEADAARDYAGRIEDLQPQAA